MGEEYLYSRPSSRWSTALQTSRRTTRGTAAPGSTLFHDQKRKMYQKFKYLKSVTHTRRCRTRSQDQQKRHKIKAKRKTTNRIWSEELLYAETSQHDHKETPCGHSFAPYHSEEATNEEEKGKKNSVVLEYILDKIQDREAKEEQICRPGRRSHRPQPADISDSLVSVKER